MIKSLVRLLVGGFEEYDEYGSENELNCSLLLSNGGDSNLSERERESREKEEEEEAEEEREREREGES